MTIKPLLVLISVISLSAAGTLALPSHADAWSEYTRTYSPYNGDHYYTARQAQVRSAQSQGYNWEGMMGYVQDTPATDATALYGAYSPTYGHFYTVNQSEYNSVANYGFTQEGVYAYVAQVQASDTMPMYRFLLPSGKHFYTVSETEKNQLTVQGGSYEGTAGYTYKTSPQMVETYQHTYQDGRPAPKYRQPFGDDGIVLRHGDTADKYGARDAYVYSEGGTYTMSYDGANGSKWSVNEATSTDLHNWTKLGSKLEESVSCGCYGTIHKAGPNNYLMYYIGSPNQFSDTTPNIPYSTRLATSTSPTGPWTKQGATFPLTGYYRDTGSPGPIIQNPNNANEYLMFFSAMLDGKRGLGIARATSMQGPWTPDQTPIIPGTEQVENIALYQQGQRWFLLTNHIGINGAGEYTDAIWTYWSDDINTWNTNNKAVVIDGQVSSWTKMIIGLPTVTQKDGRLAILYDGKTTNDQDHLNRDIGLGWLALPLQTP